MLQKLTVIGLGLIGGSLIRALREADAVAEVIGCANSQNTLDRALKLDIIDIGETNLEVAVQNADVVVIATPVGAIKNIIKQISPFIKDNTIVTDVGSVKKSIIDDIELALGAVPVWFVPGHPIAGTENSGVHSSFKALFEHRRIILTPCSTTKPEYVEKISKMWQITGAEVSIMSAVEHDKILGASSHLPHILAYSLLELLSSDPKLFEYSGGGFKDFTRIAASNPLMWRDICLANKQEISKLISRYKQSLSEIETCINNMESEQLLAKFTVAQTARAKYLK